MSKAVLMSINPKWVAMILNGKKTIEVRKTAPKLETPFKVYVYCTKKGKGNHLRLHVNDMKGRKDVGVATWWRDRKSVLMVNEHLPNYRFNSYLAEGKVIAEFTCDNVRKFEVQSPSYWYMMNKAILEQACLTKEELHDYIGAGNLAHGLHISDLKVYDQPKELSEFYTLKKCNSCKVSGYPSNACQYDEKCVVPSIITRPPQSWQFVEELKYD